MRNNADTGGVNGVALMTTRRMTASAIRSDFGETVNRVAYKDETVIIERRGKPLAVLMSWDRYSEIERVMESLEEHHDAEIIGKRMGDEAIPLDQALKELATE